MKNQIIQGDCIEQMKLLEENSVDAIVTDPPYGLEFMGKDWDKFKHGNTIMNPQGAFEHKKGFKKMVRFAKDYETMIKMQLFFKEFGEQALRILKPGGFLLSFGGTRTYHRLVCGIEDAGFEIRDTIMWLYGSGFPKSLNIGKQIDKIQGNEREELEPTGRYKSKFKNNVGKLVNTRDVNSNDKKDIRLIKGNSEWEGWGTALKPACEPIVVARKPLSEKNVALNVLKWGTGGINIDDCRIGTDKSDKNWRVNPSIRNKETEKHLYGDYNEHNTHNLKEQGRFPANIILDEEAGKMLDEQSGISISSGGKPKSAHNWKGFNGDGNTANIGGLGDKGGASRFFYCAKASKSERNLGCEDMEQKDSRKEDGSSKSLEIFSNQYTESSGNPTGRGITSKRANNHPTVKPIKLMEYLVKLVSREGATVLDPFLGSGTTAIACIKLNRNFIGIEKEEEYIKIAQARIKPFQEQTKPSQ